MPTYNNVFAINGVVDTSGTILSNLQEICKASGCWLSYNIALGKWDVVINTTGSSVKSFDVSNIVGSVSVMTTALTEYYNSVEIEFPHRDLKDTRDFENYSIATGNLLPNERTNLLTITSKLINNPVQAQLIAARELKQSRVDKVIQFTTDYTSLGLQAGDLIDVTLTQYAFNSKVFRITSLEEEDDNEGNLLIRITALEYDANVYSTSGLTYTEKTLDNQIRYGGNNSSIITSDQISTAKDVSNSLNDAATAATFMSSLTRKGSNPGLNPLVDVFQVNQLNLTADNTTRTVSLGRTITLPYTGNYSVNYNINWGSDIQPTPPLGMVKNSTIVITLNNSAVSLGNWASTGDNNVQVYEDHNLTGLFSGTAGQTLAYSFAYRSNLSAGSYTVPAGYPAFTVPANTIVAVWIIAELYYTGS